MFWAVVGCWREYLQRYGYLSELLSKVGSHHQMNYTILLVESSNLTLDIKRIHDLWGSKLMYLYSACVVYIIVIVTPSHSLSSPTDTHTHTCTCFHTHACTQYTTQTIYTESGIRRHHEILLPGWWYWLRESGYKVYQSVQHSLNRNSHQCSNTKVSPRFEDAYRPSLLCPVWSSLKSRWVSCPSILYSYALLSPNDHYLKLQSECHRKNSIKLNH